MSLFAELAPQTLVLPLPVAEQSVILGFEELDGISVGSPVLAQGRLVGTVVSVEPKAKGGFSVEVDIATEQNLELRDGTIGLISSPLSQARTKPERVIELLVPANGDLARSTESLRGFSSYEDFWASTDPLPVSAPANAS